jgi:hypothetical protein
MRRQKNLKELAKRKMGWNPYAQALATAAEGTIIAVGRGE